MGFTYQWIKYQIVCGKNENNEDVIINKRVGYSEENLAIAQREAYNGYEIIEDEKEIWKEPIPINKGGTDATNEYWARMNIVGCPMATIKISRTGNLTSISSDKNTFDPFYVTSDDNIEVSCKRGELSFGTKLMEQYGEDRTNYTVRGIYVDDENINMLRVSASVYLYNKGSSGSSPVTIYLCKYSAFDETEEMLALTRVQVAEGFRNSGIMSTIIENVNLGDFIYLRGYKVYAGRNVDVYHECNGTHLAVEAIG